jgi:hypothetical protein
MVPQVAVEIADSELRNEFVRSLQSCKSASGVSLFQFDVIGNLLSITLVCPTREDLKAGFFTTGVSRSAWEEAGISVYNIDAGTGYHVPEGAMAVYGAGIPANGTRQVLRDDQAKQFLMRLAQLEQ